MDWRAEVEAARQMVAIHETLRMPGAAHPHRVIVEIGNALDAAERDRDEARAMLGELLARVHRDGGHRADAAGLAQATREADEIIARLMAERGEARAEVERLRTERDKALGLPSIACKASFPALQSAAASDEREACAALCDGIASRWEAERAAGCSDVARAAAGGTAAGALLCADAIRARGGAR